MKITKEELAAKLDGRLYGEEIFPDEIKLAKENNLVVVFGYSDDNVELRGAIDDEIGCYNGGTVKLNPNGILPEFEDVEEEDAERYLSDKKISKNLVINWNDGEYNWTYHLEDIPYATFDIFEERYKYSRGIVFSLNDFI